MQLHLTAQIKEHFGTINQTTLFEGMMAFEGVCVRAQEGRFTKRIVIQDKYYFVKQHTGVGWKEIIKNLLQLKSPVISAKNEWLALTKLKRLEIPVAILAGYGSKGCNPAKKKSFVVTEELAPIISLEDLSREWKIKPPHPWLKKIIVHEVARIARILHDNGVNHRDFYLCHFLLDVTQAIDAIKKDNCKIYLIDLHRAQIRKSTPTRWMIKDLASLYFSSMDIGLTKRDFFRFMKIYRGLSLRQILVNEATFWQKVLYRGKALYRHHK